MLLKTGLSPFTALLGALHNRQLGVDALHETLQALVPLFGDAEAHIAAIDVGALHDLRHWLTQADVLNQSAVTVLLWQLLHRLLNLFEARLAFVHDVDGIDLILEGLAAAKAPVRLAAARAMRRLAEAPDSFHDLLKPKKVLGRLLLGLFDAEARVACELTASLAALLPYRPTAATLADYQQMLTLLTTAPSADEQLLVARCLWNVATCPEAHDLLIETGAVDAATRLLASDDARLATAGAGLLMALAVSLRGKQAAVAGDAKAIEALCAIVQHHADQRLRANAAIALRHIGELDAGLMRAGAELIADPVALHRVFGSRATAKLVDRHLAGDEAGHRAHAYGALRVLLDDGADGCEAALASLNVMPALISDAERGDPVALDLLRRLVAGSGDAARAHLDVIARRNEGGRDADLIRALLSDLNVSVFT